MAYEIVLAPGAAEAFKALPASRRAELQDALEVHLRHEPRKVKKSRIKRLRGLSRPQYRLRVGELRVFYDDVETEVQVLAVVSKAQAQGWLEQEGVADEGGGISQG
jgi:mRNA-degrading endonuclease RelE of RelBE toxin-antitoxin system